MRIRTLGAAFVIAGGSLGCSSSSGDELLGALRGEWTNKYGDVRFYFSADSYFGVDQKHCSTSTLRVLTLNSKTRTLVARIAPEKGDDAGDIKVTIDAGGNSALLSNRTKLLARVGALRVSPEKSKDMRLDELPFTDPPDPIRKLSGTERPNRNDCQKN